MSNLPHQRFLHLSRFLIAIGLFILITMLFGLIASQVLRWVWNIDSTVMLSKKAANFTHLELVGIKVYQSISACSFVFSAFVITKVFKVSFQDFTHLNIKPKAIHILMAVGVFICLIPVVNTLVIFNGQLSLPEAIAKVFKEVEFKSDNIYAVILNLNSGKFFVFNILLMALLPAIGEELVFRGILMRIFTQWKQNIHWGIAITSFLFALLHFQPYKFIPMFVIAMALGYLYYFTGSLWVTIIVHFINNAVVVISDLLIKLGADWQILHDDFNFPVYVTLLATVVGFAIYYTLNKRPNIVAFD